MSSATLPLNVRIILSDPFPDRFSSCVVCVCNHCCGTNQNFRLMIGLTSTLFCAYDSFVSYRFYFSLMKSLKMMDLGLGYLVHAILNSPLVILLVVSVAQDLKW